MSVEPESPDQVTSIREAQRQFTRQKLIEAARQVFHAKGFDETTVEDIAVAAGASRGTFYLHFKSKGEALGEILSIDYIEPMMELLESLPADPSPVGLQSWIERYLDLYHRHRLTLRAWLQSTSRWLELRESADQMMSSVIDGFGTKITEIRKDADRPVSAEKVKVFSLVFFTQVQQFGYFRDIRDWQVDTEIGVGLLANLWHAVILGDQAHLLDAD